MLVDEARSGIALAAMWTLEGIALGSLWTLLLALAIQFLERKIIARLWAFMQCVRLINKRQTFSLPLF